MLISTLAASLACENLMWVSGSGEKISQNGFIDQQKHLDDLPNGFVGKATDRDVLMKETTAKNKDGLKHGMDPISGLLTKLERCRLLADQYENPRTLETSANVEETIVSVESTVTTEVEIHNSRPIGGTAQADPTATKLSAALHISSKPPNHQPVSAAHCCSDVGCSANRPLSTWAECLPKDWKTESSRAVANSLGFGLQPVVGTDGISRFSSLIEPLNDGISIDPYQNEHQMPAIMKLITKDLSEPYSIYTYRYFIHNWPHLCFLANAGEDSIGAIVCKLDYHKTGVRRGYIAMLAVDEKYRRHKIGSRLVKKAIHSMIEKECDEVVLETEVTNKSALGLYERLGFVRDKRLFRYYLNGVDAFRLKLWLRNPYTNLVQMYE